MSTKLKSRTRSTSRNIVKIYWLAIDDRTEIIVSRRNQLDEWSGITESKHFRILTCSILRCLDHDETDQTPNLYGIIQ